jgi:hypothetical protein
MVWRWQVPDWIRSECMVLAMVSHPVAYSCAVEMCLRDDIESQQYKLFFALMR